MTQFVSQERFALVGMEKVKVWALVKQDVLQIQIVWKTKFAKLLDPTSLASLEIVHALEAAAIQVNHALTIIIRNQVCFNTMYYQPYKYEKPC